MNLANFPAGKIWQNFTKTCQNFIQKSDKILCTVWQIFTKMPLSNLAKCSFKFSNFVSKHLAKIWQKFPKTRRKFSQSSGNILPKNLANFEAKVFELGSTFIANERGSDFKEFLHLTKIF